MKIHAPLTLLGGISPAEFMQRYWQRKPLLVRQAIPGFRALLDRRELFALSQQPEVESRLVIGENAGQRDWQLHRGPFKRRDFPKLSERDWTLLVQGVDLHDERVSQLMHQFRFIPDARLDDVMISYATDGGGVGPHFDSYDVFLLQAHGQRRWRIGRQNNLQLQAGLPLKILAHFEPEHDWVLEPGDMLYLPPRYAHEGVAVGECMTYSIGFRVPQKGDVAREILGRLSDEVAEDLGAALYQDAGQTAVAKAAQVPESMQQFVRQAIAQALSQPAVTDRLLGEYLTEPKAQVWFEPQPCPPRLKAVTLDRRSRMLYDRQHVFLNGESWRAAGADAKLMRRLADQRALTASDLKEASPAARALLKQWCADGWLHPRQA